MKSIMRLTVVAALVLVSSMAQARLPGWYPQQGFQHWGKIDEVRSKDSTVIIGDMLYTLRDGVIVHSLSQKYDSLARVRKGVTVGFVYDEIASGEWRIREIWLLPDTYSQPGD